MCLRGCRAAVRTDDGGSRLVRHADTDVEHIVVSQRQLRPKSTDSPGPAYQCSVLDWWLSEGK